jgi:ATP phosphoribosyltransferase
MLWLSRKQLLSPFPEGRLQQATLDLLAGSDIQFHRENRKDIALVKNHDIALVFLPAGDIPMFVRKGRVDLGITGGDQVAEHEAKLLLKREEMSGDGHEDGKVDIRGVEEVLKLGFGKCRLQVQVPEKGKLQTPKELVGRNVVTSFVGLTEQYFARLEGQEKGMTNGDVAEPLTKRLKTQIEYAGGSVEAACALGAADGIVDLVGMGPTVL